MHTILNINNTYKKFADELLKDGYSEEKISLMLSRVHLSVLSEEENLYSVKDIEEMIDSCRACYGKNLVSEVLKPVHGRGKPAPVDIFFVGLMPGDTEAETGKVFSGPNSLVFVQGAKEAGIGGDDCPTYLHNLVCCQPLKKIKKKQIRNCSLFLAELLYLLSPNIVVTLGSEALSYMMGKKCKLQDYEGEVQLIGKYIVVPLKHQSAIHRIPDEKMRKSEIAKYKSELQGIKAMNDRIKKLRDSKQMPF